MGWFGGKKAANGTSNGAARAEAAAPQSPPQISREDKAKVDAAGGVPDMTALENLGEWSMLRNLELRLIGKSEPYTLVSTVLVAVTIIIAMIAGYYLAPSLGIWGRVIAGLICVVGWYVLAQSTDSAFKLDNNVFKAVIAVVIASVVSAAMGAYVWASVGEMGASAWTIVFPGWAMGDIVASILGLGVLFSLTGEMKKRGLSTY